MLFLLCALVCPLTDEGKHYIDTKSSKQYAQRQTLLFISARQVKSRSRKLNVSCRRDKWIKAYWIGRIPGLPLLVSAREVGAMARWLIRLDSAFREEVELFLLVDPIDEMVRA
jgi:hypothetical protein